MLFTHLFRFDEDAVRVSPAGSEPGEKLFLGDWTCIQCRAPYSFCARFSLNHSGDCPGMTRAVPARTALPGLPARTHLPAQRAPPERERAAGHDIDQAAAGQHEREQEIPDHFPNALLMMSTHSIAVLLMTSTDTR